MILDTMSNAARFEVVHKSFKTAFDYIRNNNLEALKPGRYEIDGEAVFALVQSYATKDIEEKQFEAHNNYIDIQYMINGSEMMGYTTFDNLTVKAAYDPEKDCEFYNHTTMTECRVDAGMFAIFFPEDPHMPGCQIRGQGAREIQKLVLKIRIS